MDIVNRLNELRDPLKQLVNKVKPDWATEYNWFSFARSEGALLSVERDRHGVFTFLITKEPGLALKVTLDQELVNFGKPVSIGTTEDLLNMIVSAINKLKD